MQTDLSIDIHENHNALPVVPSVAFELTQFDDHTSNPWGVLRVTIRQPDNFRFDYKYFLHGPEWQTKAAAIRDAFRSPVSRPFIP